MRRTEFLAATAAGAAAPALVAAAPAEDAGRRDVPFDRAAFEAILNRPYRHRQVFASTALEQGAVLNYMQNSLNAYAGPFGEGPGTLHVAAVFYGWSLVAMLDEAMWDTYRIRDVLAALPRPDPIHTPAPPPLNPYAATIATLGAAGASFFVCNNAFHGITRFLADKLGRSAPADAQAAYDECARHIIAPGMLVPAGVAALNAAQEARFTLVQATMS